MNRIEIIFAFVFLYFFLFMGRTPFYRTLNELEHHYLNIAQTQTPYFGLRTIEHPTLNAIGLSLELHGDPNQNFPFQMAVTLKLSSSDPMLVKPKCV